MSNRTDYVILGGTGHVGSAAAKALLAQGRSVTIITHSREKAPALQAQGAEVAVADVHDTGALRDALRGGRRGFLLNPPAAPSTDTDVEERRTVAAILEALDGSGLEKVVAESAYGAQPGERCGDLSVLYGLEQGLAAQPVPAAIIRAAYYMSNWDSSLQSARDEGVVRTMYPADFELPMVAPADLGQAAARLLAEPADKFGVHYVEGPERYSSADVATAFAEALGKPVRVETVPRDKWIEAYQALGFSEPAARSYANMTGATLDDDSPPPEHPVRGEVTLQAYVRGVVDGARPAPAP